MGARSSGRPGPHPEPPTNLHRRPLSIAEFQQAWSRIYQCRYDLLHFDRTGRSRFDAPEGQYGVLYVAGDERCAFVETFGQSTGTNTVTTSALEARCLCLVTTEQPLRLVDLRGEGLSRIGADGRLTTGDYTVAQH